MTTSSDSAECVNVKCHVYFIFWLKSRQPFWFLFGTALKIKITLGRSPNAKGWTGSGSCFFKGSQGQTTTRTILHYRNLAQNQVKARCNHHSRKHAQGECPHELLVRPGVWRQQSANHPSNVSNISRKELVSCAYLDRRVEYALPLEGAAPAKVALSPLGSKTQQDYMDSAEPAHLSQPVFIYRLSCFRDIGGLVSECFRPLDVCMDRTCARLCVYNMKVWWCMYFAFLLKKYVGHFVQFCNCIEAWTLQSAHPKCFLTHGTMLPVWSSDRAHAGRCLAKADCRFTSSKTAMGLKKYCPCRMEKARLGICWWVFLVANISRGSTWCDVVF